ncbi:hypothetical protein AAF712_008463 [Marasmius tenuissimus]|uniref:Uncharacterized protein n=1 Tax=Marasmius tenuissimus TaxID=585030 RepID=A0ABR2ZSS3_9AGAR
MPHQPIGSAQEVRRFLKPNPADTTQRICVFCLVMQHQGQSNAVSVYRNTTAISIVRNHFHQRHFDLWDTVLRMERLLA